MDQKRIPLAARYRGFRRNNPCLSLFSIFFPGIEPGVNDLDPAIRPQGIFGTTLGESPFERVIEAGDLVPGAKIAGQIESFHRLNSLGDPGASEKERQEQRNQSKDNDATRSYVHIVTSLFLRCFKFNSQQCQFQSKTVLPY
jgi:hypothetical protein